MINIRFLTTLFLTGLLTACQMPQKSGMPMPSPSMPSGSPSPSQPTSSPAPSGEPSDPASSSDSDSSSDSSGEPSASEPGSPGGGEGEPGGMSGEPLPMPGAEGPQMPGGTDGLDEQLDEALEDFDETVMGEAGASGEEGIDILDPMGGGSSGEGDEPPLYEEGDLDGEGEGSGSNENAEIAQRAESGAPSGAESSPSGEGSEGSSGESSSSSEQSSSQSQSASGGGAAAPIDGQATGGAEGQAEAVDENIIPIPDDVGDGRNDDIVLRQVRDAAMQEEDPVLRDKLWDEYRRIRDQR